MTEQLRKAIKAGSETVEHSVKSDKPVQLKQPTAEQQLGDQKVRLLIKQYQDGASAKDLAVRFEISKHSVRRLLTKHKGRHKDAPQE
ncbi:hypothetical protein [Amycolatopsis sp. H20-H5]|uniref:hypothetical protein n=1 Tax=Amycolatopsis sp. H20-H5 TaxID=3046309 RepID=UPI002DB7A83F|nr:hypothetical protein [Amycolatopsis sp. H20-H5]MEC3980420.1 hypothetical protein [Amycolatopsis sp. H20-H5]